MAAPVFVDGVTGLNAATFNALGAEVDAKQLAATAIQTYAGTQAARPAANAVPAGSIYYATDSMSTWRTNGSAWTLVQQGSPRISPASLDTAPWNAPYGGMRVTLVPDPTGGIEWDLVYNSGAASAYKWDFVGGAPLEAGTGANESTASTTPVELTTKQRLTLPRGGDYLARFGCSAYGPVGVNVFTYLFVAGASVDTVTVNLPVNVSQSSFPGRELRVNGRATGEVADIRFSTASGSTNFLERSFTLTPIRIL